MRKTIILALVTALAFTTAPAGGTHVDTDVQPYFGGAGGTVDDGSTFPPTIGFVFCDEIFGTGVNWQDLGQGCIGGFSSYSDHAVPASIPEEDPLNPVSDWANGYTRVTATATDTLFGSQVALWVCLLSVYDGGSCGNFDDWITRSCGLGQTTADTDDYLDRTGDHVDPGFLTVWTVLFIDTLFIDATTSNVCTASNGSISVVFSP